MTKQEAMRIVKKLVNQQRYQYSYIYYLNTTNEPIELSKINQLHLSFKTENFLNEIQMAISFYDDYYDVLAFPHPFIVTDTSITSISKIVRFLNFLNSYIKMGNGRFYLDEDFADIVFSVRIPYYVLEAFPLESIENSVAGTLNFYMDIAEPLYNVVKEEITIEEAYSYMKEIWQ